MKFNVWPWPKIVRSLTRVTETSWAKMKRSNLYHFFFFSSKKKKLGISKSRVLTGNKSASPQLIHLSRTHRAKHMKGLSRTRWFWPGQFRSNITFSVTWTLLTPTHQHSTAVFAAEALKISLVIYSKVHLPHAVILLAVILTLFVHECRWSSHSFS